MALGSDMLERVLGMPLADAIPFARSRLGAVCCYAFPHVALYGLVYLVYLYDANGGDPTTTGMSALGIGFLVYAAVINAVGEYIANLDIFTSQAVGASNSIASTFGALCSRAVAFFLVFIAPASAFPSTPFFGLKLSAGCVYLSFTIGVGGYLSAVLFPEADESRTE